MYRDVLLSMQVLATAILMLLAGQLKEIAVQVLQETTHVVRSR